MKGCSCCGDSTNIDAIIQSKLRTHLCDACLVFLSQKKDINKSLKCKYSFNCQISVATRNKCGACRYYKIISNPKFPLSKNNSLEAVIERRNWFDSHGYINPSNKQLDGLDDSIMSIDNSRDGLSVASTSTNTIQSPGSSRQCKICDDYMDNKDSTSSSEFKSKICASCRETLGRNFKIIKV